MNMVYIPTLLRRQKKFFLIVFATFTFSYVITSLLVHYYQDELEYLPDIWYTAMDYFYPDDTVCYNKIRSNNFIGSIMDKVFMYNSIFFHDTSCYRSLSLRQACAVESAARAHPNRQVNVLFTKSLSESQCFRGPLGEIYKLPNVDFSRIDMNAYAVNTPLQRIFSESLTKYGKRHYRRVAEYLKFLTLYRFGGMVVDLDMMIVAPVDYLGSNWVAMADGNKLGSAVISLSKHGFGKKVAKWLMSAARTQHEQEEIDGGKALFDVMEYLCNTSDIKEMTFNRCQGIQLYDKEFFYPVNSSTWRDLLKPGDLDDLSFGYHMWGGLNSRAAIPQNSLYATLARRFCPSVFNRFIYAFIDYNN